MQTHNRIQSLRLQGLYAQQIADELGVSLERVHAALRAMPRRHAFRGDMEGPGNERWVGQTGRRSYSE